MTEGLNTVERQKMDVDIVCVGFGPAMGGFLTTLSKAAVDENGMPRLESKVLPGSPLQVICYERADDVGFGVSGVVTRARAIKASLPGADFSQIPMCHPVTQEKVAYLLDPVGASRRSASVQILDRILKTFKFLLPLKNHSVELPYIPPFLQKHHGMIFSLGQFNQWIASQVMSSGLIQIWPGMPVQSPLIENDTVKGIRLVDQGTDKEGNPSDGFMPGMDIHAQLSVIGDGPVGAVGQQLDQHFRAPENNHKRDWAVGMKVVVELPDSCTLKPGTVLHTFGYPEPEIFGFLYVFADRLASLGIFVPSWFDSPTRATYRYLQYWMQHPYIWQHLEGGTLKSWGAKSLQESGLRGEPVLAGNGFARIGEGSGSTNVLTGSGVDEAWATGVQLAEGVIDLWKSGKEMTAEHLQQAYVNRRHASWVGKEGRVAKKARDGFQVGFLTGLIGMGLTGITGGLINVGREPKRPWERIPSLEKYYGKKLSHDELKEIRKQSNASGTPMYEALMEHAGWPKVNYDGKLLLSHQDALLLGGKVQAASGYADHVRFVNHHLCGTCLSKVCIEGCSGQAISPSEDGGVPNFDREKCVHCGACLWNCAVAREDDPERSNIAFSAGVGGLHSAEN